MTLKCLFIPVSSPKGIGEYMRSRIVADALAEYFQYIGQTQELKVGFVLSAETDYHKDCPYTVLLTPTSPTMHSNIVNQYIRDFQPNIVIFDCSGRASQLKTCKSINTTTVFICQHPGKLAKGISLRRLPFTDEIWWVQPEIFPKKLSWWNTKKLHFFRKKIVGIGPVIPENKNSGLTLSKLGLADKPFILINSGSGNHVLDGKNVSEIFSSVARALSEILELTIVLVHGVNYQGALLQNDQIREFQKLEPGIFSVLLSRASLAILSGGSSLLHALSFNVPIIAVPVAKDQFERIRLCQKHYGISAPTLAKDDIIQATIIKLKTTTQKIVDSNTEDPTPLITNGLGFALRRILNCLDYPQDKSEDK